MKNKKKINNIIIGTLLTFLLILVEVIMIIFNKYMYSYTNVECFKAPCDPIRSYNTFGILLSSLIVIFMMISIFFNLIGVFKDKEKSNKLYHIGLIIISIIIGILSMYKHL